MAKSPANSRPDRQQSTQRLGNPITGAARGGPTLRRGRGFVWVLLLISVVVLARNWAPQELSRWYLAGAMEKELDGDLAAAERLINKSLEWHPGNLDTLYFQARMAITHEEPATGLRSLRKLHRLRAPIAPTLALRAQAYEEMEQFQLAVEDWKTILVSSRRPSSTTFNNLAYMRARAGRDLDEALRHANLAISSISGDRIVWDTHGFRLYNRAVQEEKAAKRIFFRRQKLYFGVVNSLTSVLKHCSLRLVLLERATSLGDARSAQVLPQYRMFVASVFLHRARIYTAMELPKQAAADRQVVTEKMKLNIKDVRSFVIDETRLLQELAVYLDTRGWIYFQQNNYRAALTDISQALRINRLGQVGAAQRKSQYADEVDTRQLQRNKQEANRHEAVMLLHRAETHRRLGNDKQAAADEGRIRQLGLDPADIPF